MSYEARRRAVFGAFALALGLPLWAQIAFSPGDPTGVSIAYPFVHLLHSEDETVLGGTAYFARQDPFVFYQLGRDLLQRQFQLQQGVYGRPGKLSVPLYVEEDPSETEGSHARLARDHTSSCGFCHSVPYREPGGGQTIGSTGGAGRNSTHFFGAGLVEMLGEQIRAELFDLYDSNRNGVIDRAEVAESRPARIRPAPGAAEVDFGDLAPGADGVPRLNSLFRVWYLDAQGQPVKGALSLSDPRVASFNFAAEAFGWGRGWRQIGSLRVSQGGEAATIRAFYTGAADVHMGLQAFDPSQLPTAGGLARVSLAGAQQYALGGSVDPGLHQTSTGLSLDDPDGDHHPSELVEGDVDAVEFYMLHAPAPAVRATADTEPGRKLLAEIGCTRCHVESWQIEGRDPARGLAGDRRLFRLELSSRPAADGSVALVGRLVRQFRRTPSGGYEPLGGPFRVQGLYTDFKHWDVGPRFWERRFDGSVQKEHRTAPLWGVGSTAPYGHTGEFLSLEEVIEAHDGEALREREAYDRLEPAARRTLIEFLKSLVLYATDEIPADIDGDGSAAESFQVGGVDVGYERFDARWLAADPPRYRALDWLTDAYGRKRRLVLLDNPAEVFGLDLPARKDSDGDGFPDAMDPTPNRPGLSDETPATSH